jgi:hypothetical protein
MQVVTWLVVKTNCRINIPALFKWQYILVHLYRGNVSVTARQRVNQRPTSTLKMMYIHRNMREGHFRLIISCPNSTLISLLFIRFAALYTVLARFCFGVVYCFISIYHLPVIFIHVFYGHYRLVILTVGLCGL